MTFGIELLKESELRQKLGVSRGTINNWKRRGMPHIKIGRLVRFELNKVMQWAETQGGKNGGSDNESRKLD